MTSRVVLCGAVLTAWLFAPLPAAAQNRVDQQLFLDIRAVQEQNRQLLLVLNGLSEQVKALGTKIDAESSARSKGFADLQSQTGNLNSSVAALQERVSDSKVQIQKTTQELEAAKKGIDMLTVMVTQALAQMPASAAQTAAADPNAPPSPAPQAAPAAGGVPASSKDYYDRAFSDYTVGQYPMAIEGFNEYLKRFPEAPEAAQAQNLIGQSYFMMGKYQDAVAAYAQVIKKYKSVDAGDTVPEAYYKQGIAYEQLKQRDQAIANYELVRKEYPNSTAALQAAQDLQRLKPVK